MTISFKDNSSWNHNANNPAIDTYCVTVIRHNDYVINLHHDLTSYGLSDKYRYDTYIEVLKSKEDITNKLAKKLNVEVPIKGDSDNLFSIIDIIRQVE